MTKVENMRCEKLMTRTNYYAIVRENGSIDEVFTSRKEAEEYYNKFYVEDIKDPDYTMYNAEIIRGLDNIINYAKSKGVTWTKSEIKERA